MLRSQLMNQFDPIKLCVIGDSTQTKEVSSHLSPPKDSTNELIKNGKMI